jgi:hypothetical protein
LASTIPRGRKQEAPQICIIEKQQKQCNEFIVPERGVISGIWFQQGLRGWC